jgi:hypothetical protein
MPNGHVGCSVSAHSNAQITAAIFSLEHRSRTSAPKFECDDPMGRRRCASRLPDVRERIEVLRSADATM